jgi:UDP-N-acetylmuramoyl-tripeptide--D-alanyl-D-alanine ligase
MRLNMVKNRAGVTIINDAYNANPTSMESGLVTLMELKGEARAVAVLGDMLELGPAAREAHWNWGKRRPDWGSISW